MTNAIIDLQEASEHAYIPSRSQFGKWVDATISAANNSLTGSKTRPESELTIRIVDEAESQELNHQYRHKNNATNVLSFPFEMPIEIAADLAGEINLLGDMVICAPIVAKEAKEQQKSALAHWAHLVVHGTLHLQGYDHIDELEAQEMEALEVVILNILGFSDPYLIAASSLDR